LHPLFCTPTLSIFSLLCPRFDPITMLHTMAQQSSVQVPVQDLRLHSDHFDFEVCSPLLQFPLSHHLNFSASFNTSDDPHPPSRTEMSHHSVRNSSLSLPFLLVPGPDPTSNGDLLPPPVLLYSRKSPKPAILRPCSVYFPLLHRRFSPRTTIHTMAHQSSGAGTRAGSRWQPYGFTSSSLPKRSCLRHFNLSVSFNTSDHSPHPPSTQREPCQGASLIGKCATSFPAPCTFLIQLLFCVQTVPFTLTTSSQSTRLR